MAVRLGEFKKSVIKLKKVAFDTSCFIYHIEENQEYLALTQVLFEELLPHGRIEAVGSTLLLTEILTRPFEEGREDLVLAYKALLSGFPNFKIYPLDKDIAQEAARLRAQHRLKRPDAIHIATALASGAKGIVGNDASWKKVADTKVVVLADFAASSA